MRERWPEEGNGMGSRGQVVGQLCRGIGRRGLLIWSVRSFDVHHFLSAALGLV